MCCSASKEDHSKHRGSPSQDLEGLVSSAAVEPIQAATKRAERSFACRLHVRRAFFQRDGSTPKEFAGLPAIRALQLLSTSVIEHLFAPCWHPKLRPPNCGRLQDLLPYTSEGLGSPQGYPGCKRLTGLGHCLQEVAPEGCEGRESKSWKPCRKLLAGLDMNPFLEFPQKGHVK